MFLYANLLRTGQGVARDDAKALALYQAAAACATPVGSATSAIWRS